MSPATDKKIIHVLEQALSKQIETTKKQLHPPEITKIKTSQLAGQRRISLDLPCLQFF